MNQIAIDQLFARKHGAGGGDCYRCGRSLRALKASTKASRQFKKMTGLVFSRPCVSLNIAVDSTVLRATAPVSGRGDFCCDCAVAYMTEFNRLNAAMRAN